MTLVEIYLKITGLLATPLIVNNLLYLDIWSFIHFAFGFILVYLVMRFKKKRPYLKLFALLAIFEVIEYFLGITAPSLVPPELAIDTIWDFIFGMGGGYTYEKAHFKVPLFQFIRRKKK